MECMMFNKAPGESAPVEVEPSDLIPLSHFALDHPQPSEGWSNFLGRRGITLRPDRIGRDAISSRDAQMLLHEKRAEELRAAKLRQLAEQEAVAADERRRDLIWKGVSATALPEGMAPATAMLLAGHDERPRRKSPVAEVLDGESMTFHSYGDQEAS
jgi:hypothetical protein